MFGDLMFFTEKSYVHNALLLCTYIDFCYSHNYNACVHNNFARMYITVAYITNERR